MRKLLSANFSRLWKSKAFWLCTAAMFIISIVSIYSSAQSAKTQAEYGYVHSIDDYYFVLAPIIAVILGLFISLFLGTEHSDGTFRNKLIVGHSRANIYLANFIVCLMGCLIITAAWLIGGIPGIFLIGPFKMGFSGFAVYTLLAIGMTAAFTAIFVWVATASTNKALTLVFMMIVFATMILSAGAVNDRLTETEFNGGMAYIDGQFVMQEATPNPLYISGTTRTVVEWIRDLMPMGQAIPMTEAIIEYPARGIIASVVTSVVVTAFGVVSFRRKALR